MIEALDYLRKNTNYVFDIDYEILHQGITRMTTEEILKNYLNQNNRRLDSRFNPEKGITIAELIIILGLFEDQEMEVAIRHEAGGTDLLCLEEIGVGECHHDKGKKYLFLREMG